MIAQATSAADPVKPINCVTGRRRMNRVSFSERRNTRRSGKYFSKSASVLIAKRVLTRSSSYIPIPKAVLVIQIQEPER